MATSAAPAELIESFEATAQSIVDLSIHRAVTREALAASPRSGIRKLAGRLFYGVRQLVELADRYGVTSATSSPLLTERLSGAVKKIAVKAGSSIIVDAIVPLIPLGWLSIAGVLIRPIIRRALYWGVDLLIDTIVAFRKDDI